MRFHFPLAAILIASAIASTHIYAEDQVPGAPVAEPVAGAMHVEAAWLTAPKMADAPEFTAEGVRAVYFDGIAFKGKPTTVFAWIGLPKVDPASAGKKVPAMVLVHGGDGTAFDAWVRLWTSHGYAAIAMDNCGQVPRGTSGHWERNPQGGPAGWGGFATVNDPPEDQWTYQAVADVVLANSLIRSLPEVDADRIGITGISWGGYLACIVAGLDDRFKFAVPVYGCGYLGDDSVWLPKFAKLGTKSAAEWLARWDPSHYLPNAKMPMLWVDGTNDFAYPLDSLQKSYLLATGPRTLCTRVRMVHGHEQGWSPPEIRAFADDILKGETPLAKVTAQGRDGQDIWARYESKSPIVKAELIYTKDVGVWQKRKWNTSAATIDTAAQAVHATLPEGTRVYFLNLIDERGLIVSTQHEELPAAGGAKSE
jgi:dienelactone hydrolase